LRSLSSKAFTNGSSTAASESSTATTLTTTNDALDSDNNTNSSSISSSSILLTSYIPNKREAPLHYHGRIVATPLPDYIAIRDRRRVMNTATTTTTTSTMTSSSHGWLDTVLLPKHNHKYNRAIEKEIDPISIYGTSDIPIEHRKARFGPIYYQPQHHHVNNNNSHPHFDWCTNTANQIYTKTKTTTKETPISTNTATSESSTNRNHAPPQHLHSMRMTGKVPLSFLFDTILDNSNEEPNHHDILSAHSRTPIPMPLNPSPQITTKQLVPPNLDDYHQIPTAKTKLSLYLYQNPSPESSLPQSGRDMASDTKGIPSTLPLTTQLPQKNILLDFDRSSSEYVTETLQRISIKLLQHHTGIVENSTKIYYSGNRRKQQGMSKKILLNKHPNSTPSIDRVTTTEDETLLSNTLQTHYKASVWYISNPNMTRSCRLGQSNGMIQPARPNDENDDTAKPTTTTTTATTTTTSNKTTTTTSTVPPDGRVTQEILPPLMTELNVINYTNRDLWNLGLQTPLAIIFTLHENSNNQYPLQQPYSQSQQQPFAQSQQRTENKLPKELCFLLEAFPPTIYSVTAFEYWGTYIYVGVPITIQVETLYATNSRVDWFLNGIYYQSTYDNAHTYIPLLSHLHKKVTLLITPYRNYDDAANSNDTNPNSFLKHTGIGCEKAYRFRRIVETLPVNRILNVRNNWLLETKHQHLLDRYNNNNDDVWNTGKNSIDNDSGNNRSMHEIIESGRIIRVMTYNLLADSHAYKVRNQITTYPYVNKDIMDKARRMPLILHEILAYNADVICLQEVDYLVFETLLHPTLQQYGYEGYYSSKHDVNSNEGCAMFWSLRSFASVSEEDQQTVLLRDLVEPGDGNGTNDEVGTTNEWSSVNQSIWSLLLQRPDLHMVLSTQLPHVAQMVPLMLLDHPSSDRKSHFSSRPIWVTNTHLYYHPQASHIRLLQMVHFLRHVHGFIKNVPGEILLCGDLNSSAQTSTGKLILNHTVPKNYRRSQIHLNTFRDTTLTLDDEFPSFTLPDSFPVLRSAIDPPAEFTHCTHEFCGTLDHIIYSTSSFDRILPKSSAPMPSEYDVTNGTVTGMPSLNIPSDHVSLVCDFVVKEDESEK
jgi:mRNA deadenylase 3'-5' endonuclease subunit Ccr4